MEEKPAVKATETAAPPAEVVTDENETKIAALEAEKAKLIEERENYKVGLLKEKAKNKGKEEEFVDDDEEERIARITRRTLADSRLAEIAREQDELLRKALKENKELKLAHLKSKEPPAAAGAHSESAPVRDTIITPDQMEALKKRGWTDKDFERYKKSLSKYGGR